MNPFTKLGIGLPVALVVSCCDPNTPPKTVVLTCIDGGDAGWAESFESDQSAEALGGATPCARACKNLSSLGCPESLKLPSGKTCVETCKDISAISSYNPACVERAKSVEAVRACPQISCRLHP